MQRMDARIKIFVSIRALRKIQSGGGSFTIVAPRF
jgi:hypothetical protein